MRHTSEERPTIKSLLKFMGKENLKDRQKEVEKFINKCGRKSFKSLRNFRRQEKPRLLNDGIIHY